MLFFFLYFFLPCFSPSSLPPPLVFPALVSLFVYFLITADGSIRPHRPFMYKARERAEKAFFFITRESGEARRAWGKRAFFLFVPPPPLSFSSTTQRQTASEAHAPPLNPGWLFFQVTLQSGAGVGDTEKSVLARGKGGRSPPLSSATTRRSSPSPLPPFPCTHHTSLPLDLTPPTNTPPLLNSNLSR